jgi:hypothetical protein
MGLISATAPHEEGEGDLPPPLPRIKPVEDIEGDGEGIMDGEVSSYPS